jgi:JmjC domain, hydroxylase
MYLWIRPDPCIPGPKLYIAMVKTSFFLCVIFSSVLQADPDQATTKLHLDKSGALNIMFYSDVKEGHYGAEWFIWPYESIPTISKFLHPGRASSNGDADAILSEMFFLDAGDRRDIFLSSGHPPWRILQKPGDAVFIPPRHSHQVGTTPLLLLPRFERLLGIQPCTQHEDCMRLCHFLTHPHSSTPGGRSEGIKPQAQVSHRFTTAQEDNLVCLAELHKVANSLLLVQRKCYVKEAIWIGYHSILYHYAIQSSLEIHDHPHPPLLPSLTKQHLSDYPHLNRLPRSIHLSRLAWPILPSTRSMFLLLRGRRRSIFRMKLMDLGHGRYRCAAR